MRGLPEGGDLGGAGAAGVPKLSGAASCVGDIAGYILFETGMGSCPRGDAFVGVGRGEPAMAGTKAFEGVVGNHDSTCRGDDDTVVCCGFRGDTDGWYNAP